jgi:hypothetical protein
MCCRHRINARLSPLWSTPDRGDGEEKRGQFLFVSGGVSVKKNFGSEEEKVVAIVCHIRWDELNHNLRRIFLASGYLCSPLSLNQTMDNH